MPRRPAALPAALLATLLLAACGDAGSRAATGAPAGETGGSAPAAAVTDATTAALTGRFGCTKSSYDAGSGTYEFLPRGYIEFDGGAYAYRGFENPSEGRVGGGPVFRFEGGHLDGGEFTPIDDRPGQYTLTAPGIDGRWSCKHDA